MSAWGCLIANDSFQILVQQMHEAGEQLRLALAQEELLSSAVSKFPYDDSLIRYWVQARRAVERCQSEYLDAVEACKRKSR
jgi:hypothetical protein